MTTTMPTGDPRCPNCGSMTHVLCVQAQPMVFQPPPPPCQECEQLRPQLAALQRDHAASAARVARLEAICASVYQYVGIDAPVRFLNALALHDEYMEMTPDQIIETLLPTWKDGAALAQPDAALTPKESPRDR